MFKTELKARVERIFGVKVTFDRPSESMEQECVFIEIESSRYTIKAGKQIARAVGKIVLFGNEDKLPFGYFAKRIHEAKLSDTKDIHFYGFEENKGTFGNIAERSASFVFLFSAQYDPAHGELNELQTTYGGNL